MLLDLNSSSLSREPVCLAINAAIDAATAKVAEPPQRLGPSIVGDDCLRKVQLDWWRRSKHAARTQLIFGRGFHFEDRSRELLRSIGFEFAPREALKFSAFDDLLRGVADGIILSGPGIPGLQFPAIWEHKCLSAKRWRDMERNGLEKAVPKYAIQLALYQFYLDKKNPALFTVTNADDCGQLYFLVPYNERYAQACNERIATIIQATQADQLLPRNYKKADDWHCRMCPHKKFCWEEASP